MVHYDEEVDQKRGPKNGVEYWLWNNNQFENGRNSSSVVDLLEPDMGSCSSRIHVIAPPSLHSTWQGTLLSSFMVVLFLCLALFFGRHYVKYALLWAEQQDPFVVFALFLLLFTIVSFPLMWGYILLNVACGYLYGVVGGLVIVMVAVLVGMTVSHCVMRRFLSHRMASKLALKGVFDTVLSVVGGPQTFKVIAVTRLTPIPFGLQNVIFAISPISTAQYVTASVVGLFPTQAINTYLGSTLRSMDDVLSNANTATTGYIIFAVQIVISICLMAYVVQKSREALRNFILENDSSTTWPKGSSYLNQNTMLNSCNNENTPENQV